jgi:hypothetical protein
MSCLWASRKYHNYWKKGSGKLEIFFADLFEEEEK